jgi:hypothetical protein
MRKFFININFILAISLSSSICFAQTIFLKDELSPVTSQGSYGTCYAYAAGLMLEHAMKTMSSNGDYLIYNAFQETAGTSIALAGRKINYTVLAHMAGMRLRETDPDIYKDFPFMSPIYGFSGGDILSNYSTDYTGLSTPNAFNNISDSSIFPINSNPRFTLRGMCLSDDSQDSMLELFSEHTDFLNMESEFGWRERGTKINFKNLKKMFTYTFEGTELSEVLKKQNSLSDIRALELDFLIIENWCKKIFSNTKLQSPFKSIDECVSFGFGPTEIRDSRVMFTHLSSYKESYESVLNELLKFHSGIYSPKQNENFMKLMKEDVAKGTHSKRLDSYNEMLHRITEIKCSPDIRPGIGKKPNIRATIVLRQYPETISSRRFASAKRWRASAVSFVDRYLKMRRPVGVSYITAGLIKPLKGQIHTGLHASVIVGSTIINSKKHYIVQNSWGKWSPEKNTRARPILKNGKIIPGYFSFAVDEFEKVVSFKSKKKGSSAFLLSQIYELSVLQKSKGNISVNRSNAQSPQKDFTDIKLTETAEKSVDANSYENSDIKRGSNDPEEY